MHHLENYVQSCMSNVKIPDVAFAYWNCKQLFVKGIGKMCLGEKCAHLPYFLLCRRILLGFYKGTLVNAPTVSCRNFRVSISLMSDFHSSSQLRRWQGGKHCRFDFEIGLGCVPWYDSLSIHSLWKERILLN